MVSFKGRDWRGLRLIAAVVTVALVGASPSAEAARQLDPETVVINEIHYHPECAVDYSPCPDAAAEFVELHNLSETPVDLSGWSFEAGIGFTGTVGDTIGAGGYFVIAADTAGYQSVFGSAPDAVFTGGLANGGERLALVDGGSNLVDALTYDDGTEEPGSWSPTADGQGHSLQLVDAGSAAVAGPDAAGTAHWWAADTPTPSAANRGTTTPTVTDLTWTVLPTAEEPITVSAKVYGATAVTLDYRVGYPGTTQTVAMTATGASHRATIGAAAYGAGDLVRFRLRAGNTVLAPHPDDSIDWVGTTVANPAAASPVPVMEWFTTDADYQAAAADGKDDAVFYSGVLAFEGVIVDNVAFRKRGTYSTGSSWSKRNWKFKLPDHHSIKLDGIDYPVDTIDLQGGYSDDSRIREHLGHSIAAQMGLVAAQTQPVRVQLNGEFFGLHTLQEHPDGRFLSERDMPNATLYKRVEGDYEAGPTSPTADVDVGWEDWDIPAYINLLAAASVIQNNDFAHANFYWWYDRDGDERFQGMLWDLDLSQGFWWFPHSNMALELRHPTEPGRVWTRWERQAPIFALALEEPYRELYLRRVRTLADEWFASGEYEAQARAAMAALGAEWQADIDEWGVWHDPGYTKDQAITRLADTWIDGFYAHITGGGPDGDIPGPQPAEPDLSITAVPAPADQRLEHVLITNGEDTAIDISGWRLTGSTSAMLAPGSVLPAGGSASVVADDSMGGFRAVTTDRYVLGTYEADLPDADGRVDLVDPAGTVHADDVWGDGAPAVGLVLNEWNAVSPTESITGGDGRLGQVVGNGGDWFELVVVQDNLDVRGWTLRIHDSGAVDAQLAFSDDPRLADLRAGTIITVAETEITGADGTNYPEDVGYSPATGDWWIHLVAGPGGSGRYIETGSFRVSNDDWQLSIHDAEGVRRFGPAGEGVGTLAGGGVSKTEVGELEAHPTATTTAAADYGDGDESTFGAPNSFAGVTQDLDALRTVEARGDADCSGDLGLGDALFVAQYGAGMRTDGGPCPVAAGELDASGGDFNFDAATDKSDAIALLDCLIATAC